jgi:type I restriction enzyme S subunit
MMPKYDRYKDSGIERLGEIPEHWELKRIKVVSKIVNGSTPKSNIDEYWDGDITWVTPADFNGLNGKVFSSGRNITEKGYKSCGTDLVPKGSTILTCRAPIGNAAIAMNELCTNQGCKSLVPFLIDSRYLYYTIVLSEDELVSLGQGTTFLEISKTKLGNTKLTLPPKPEQNAIANYLDKKTAQIDWLIKNKKAQIERLKEIRQIEINNAVTKGLDPNVKLKPSGIEWLGDIPEHWEVKRLKNVSNKIQTGITPKTANLKYYETEDVNWFTPADFNQNIRLFDAKNKISQFAIDDNAGRLFKRNSILLLGIGATIGKVGLITEKASANQQINCVTCSKVVDPLFIAYSLKIYESEIIKFANFSTLPIFNQSNTGGLIISIPPRKEQTSIANYLDKKMVKIDRLIKNIKNQIEQLKEIRKIEIYNAVTGKIKVA